MALRTTSNRGWSIKWEVQLRPNWSKPKCENWSSFQIGCHVRTWAVFTVRLSLGVLMMVILSGSQDGYIIWLSWWLSYPIILMVILSSSHDGLQWKRAPVFNHWFQILDYFRIIELSVLMKPCKTLFINTL